MPDLTLDSVLAKAHELALNNEREIVKQVAIREKEVSELNKQIAELTNLIAAQTININNLTKSVGTTGDLKELLIKNDDRVKVIEDFMLEEKRLHECEEAEKLEALKLVLKTKESDAKEILQTKKDDAKEVKDDIQARKKPLTDNLYALAREIIFAILTGICVWLYAVNRLINK
jgi:hypothetical protein